MVMHGLQVRAPTVEEKQCPACGEVKRAALYYPNTIAPDGLSEKCRSCCKSQAAEIRCAISFTSLLVTSGVSNCFSLLA